jgi:hypothetical protein
MGAIIKTPDGQETTFICLSDAVLKAKELCGDELIDFILEETSEAGYNEDTKALSPVMPLVQAACFWDSIPNENKPSEADKEYSIAEEYQSMLIEIRDIIDERIMPLIEGRLNRKELTKAVKDIRRVSMNW